MKNNRTYILTAVIILVVVLAVFISVLYIRNEENPPVSETALSSSAGEISASIEGTEAPGGATSPVSEKDSSPVTETSSSITESAPAVTEASPEVTEKTSAVTEKPPVVTEKSTAVTKTSVPAETTTSFKAETTKAVQNNPGTEEISFPFAVPGTELIIESINKYDGVYVEDGSSDVTVSGVAAIVVKNTGSRNIDYAEIHMKGSKTNYSFRISGFEAGASLIVQEAGKAPCITQKYISIDAMPSYADEFEKSENVIKAEETSDGGLQILNLTDKKIPCVRIFYKFYSEERNMYIGGITYTVKVTELEPHAIVSVKPSHYKKGESRIIMVRTFETDSD